MKTIATALALSGMSGKAAAAKWDYDAPGNNVSHWDELVPECGYKRQSPMDVPMETLSSCSQPLELQWTSEESHYAIRNNGHSLQAMPFYIDHNGGADVSGLEVMHHTNDTNIRLTNSFYDTYESNANREYCFDSLHFHWGRDDSEGSEHTINGESYPLEVHLVHYSCDYKVIGDALTEYAAGEAGVKYDDENVLAVIGVMFEIGEPNPVIGRMLEDAIVDSIYQNHETDDIDYPHFVELYYTHFNIRDLLPESAEMVSYLGSLTTPPCYETVRWHLMKETMTVSEEQMAKFRQLLEGSEGSDDQAPNFRPTQPRYGRKVWKCQEEVAADALRKETETAQETITVEKEHKQWKNIAIGFIVLFCVSFITCFVIFYFVSKAYGRIRIVRRNKNEKQKYEQAQNGDNERIGVMHASNIDDTAEA